MSTVYVSNITLHTHTDFEQTFVLEDDQSNTRLNLTGYQGCAQLKKYESSNKSIDFTVEFPSLLFGRVTIKLSASQSASLKPGKYFYDILIKSPEGVITKVVEGTALVKKAITR